MLQRELSSVTQGRRDTGSYRNHKNMKSIVIFFPQKLNEKEEKLSKLNVRTLKPMEWNWNQNENLKKGNKEKQLQFVQLMENQKELSKILSECLMENSRLKKKISYWSNKCRKFNVLKKIKDLHNQNKCLKS